jgi:hypothetical protein
MRPISAAQTVLLPGGGLLPDGTCHREARLRPLTGWEEDWLLSLTDPCPQAQLVTELLARCVERVGPELADHGIVRSLTVADRDFLLLKLHQITFGNRVERVLSCPKPECGAKMDATFDLSAIPIKERPRQRSYVLPLGEAPRREILFRLPEGGDQEAACAWTDLPKEAQMGHLLARCILNLDGKSEITPADLETLPADARAGLEQAIEQHSPEIDFEMEATCPECGGAFTTRLEPTAFVFQEICRAQAGFEREVHLLAFHYHWPLTEILGLTRPRRWRYLGVLLNELDRGTHRTVRIA